MRRLILSASAAMIALAALPAAGADELYRPDIAIALKGGVWTADVSGVDAAPAYGAEVSFDDPLIRPPAGRMRDMLSLNRADHDGLELTTLEWNAHWVFQTHRDFWVGFGPGIGYVWADGRGVSDGAALQLGGSATYVLGHALFGIESRYQWTEGSGADNWLSVAKVGYRF